MLIPARSSGAGDLTGSRRTALVRAVEAVEPSVASVYVRTRDQVRVMRDPFWSYFYRPYTVPGRTSTGSGLVVSENGYILTNDHVIGDPRGVRSIEIALPDGRSLQARYVASDAYFDLAVLKAEAGDLPVAPLGDSDDILVGEWAIAIGNPFGFGGSVSAGVISAVDRDFPDSEGDYLYSDMIQTDASINPGNSGGPLVNALGEVIGINNSIYTGSNYDLGSVGIGFAIPINTARSFLEEIRQHGKVRKIWTGLSLQDLTRHLAEILDLPSADGTLVVDVEVESPAYVAGVERRDVLVAIDGTRVGSYKEARAAFQGYRVDDECTLTIIRAGRTESLKMRLEESPAGRRRR